MKIIISHGKSIGCYLATVENAEAILSQQPIPPEVLPLLKSMRNGPGIVSKNEIINLISTAYKVKTDTLVGNVMVTKSMAEEINAWMVNLVDSMKGAEPRPDLWALYQTGDVPLMDTFLRGRTMVDSKLFDLAERYFEVLDNKCCARSVDDRIRCIIDLANSVTQSGNQWTVTNINEKV